LPDSVQQVEQAGGRGEWFWLATLLIFAGWFYGWTATSAGSPLTSHLQSDDLYNRLADGFLAGRLGFLEQPNPALARLSDPWDPAQNAGLSPFHDVTYFRGHYYLYFGPAPALLLLAPWKAVTGSYLGQNVAAALFAWLGAGLSSALILVLRRRHFPSAPSWAVGLCLVAAPFASFALPMLRRPVCYELAIASGYAFVSASLLGIALARGRRRRFWIALASLAYGLAVASRASLVFGAVALFAPLWPAWRRWRAGQGWEPTALGDALAAALPFLAVVALLLAYNHARFGQWSEFGTSYMLAGLNPRRDVVNSFRFLPANLWFYLFAPAERIAFFPFFDVIPMPWFAYPAGYTGEEDMYGILTNMPFFWLLFSFAVCCRNQASLASSSLRDFGAAAAAITGLNALILFRLDGASNRYLLDLLPPLIPLACLGALALEAAQFAGWKRIGLRILWIGAIAYTAIFNVLVSLQHNDLLRHFNPQAYRRLAHAFDHVSVWLGQTAEDKVGPLRMRLVFPTKRIGQLEPLVVTGLSFKADFLYLYYTDPSHIQIGFEHTGYGGPITGPIRIDYASAHALRVEMGSLYPPVEHPYYDRTAPGDIARLKHALRVTLDGRTVLEGWKDFYDSSPGDVSVGRNPVSNAFGRRFTGEILESARAPSPR
jgi:hypothetical protein